MDSLNLYTLHMYTQYVYIRIVLLADNKILQKTHVKQFILQTAILVL